MIKEFEFKGVLYTASDDGKIFGKDNIELKQRFDEDGYPSVTLGKKGGRRRVRVHRIICSLFVENNENKPEVNHIDGIKSNNNYKNLEWVTRREQIIHAFKIGLRVKEDTNNFRKFLSPQEVLEIRKLYENGIDVLELSNIFGRKPQAIKDVITRKTWNFI